MLRIIFTHLLLFLIPFIGYAFWLWINRKAQTSENWRSGPLIWLAFGGIVIVSASLFFLASFEHMPEGKTYRPAEIRDGEFVPGRYE
ncbi:hypothetical protein H2509_01160 [Stappia sp. F7233]|uniref:Uncharacterized protein n=1 Tax=Stappia albiluteola TaxID=2758565 RepID=A0A839A9J6_9HYPH|nr:DUF6111 family protein [Stappia albiluteola]MBA5775728.1 hypothetical protein [Stappia albiluteola]